MASATIKVFLPFGDPKRLRTAELSNWSGKALAAPRTDFDELLKRDEALQSGVYILSGTDPESGKATVYIGEAEVLGDRLKSHKAKDFWVAVITFASKDDNLTKAHTRYLEGRLITLAKKAGRFTLQNGVASGSKLPESDRHDMEEFLSRMAILLPVLGSELLTPLSAAPTDKEPELFCKIKGLTAKGRRTPDGFLVYKGSQAVLDLRPAAITYGIQAIEQRERLKADGGLVQEGKALVFTRDVEFSSPSAAAALVHGGSANGLTAWRTAAGKTLKDIEAA